MINFIASLLWVGIIIWLVIMTGTVIYYLGALLFGLLSGSKNKSDSLDLQSQSMDLEEKLSHVRSDKRLSWGGPFKGNGDWTAFFLSLRLGGFNTKEFNQVHVLAEHGFSREEIVSYMNQELQQMYKSGSNTYIILSLLFVIATILIFVILFFLDMINKSS